MEYYSAIKVTYPTEKGSNMINLTDIMLSEKCQTQKVYTT